MDVVEWLKVMKRVQALFLWRGLLDVPQPQYSPSLVYELEESEEDEHEDDDRPENKINFLSLNCLAYACDNIDRVDIKLTYPEELLFLD